MPRHILALVAFLACALAVWADERAMLSEVRAAARKYCDAANEGNYAAVVGQMHDGFVKKRGGKDALAEELATAAARLSKGGTQKLSAAVEPGGFHSAGKNTFVVVKTTRDIEVKGITLAVSSHLVGISDDGGQTWKFVDADRVTPADFDGKLLPRLPSRLKLPEKPKGKLIKN